MATRRLHEQAGTRAVAEATGRSPLMVAGLLLALHDAGGVATPGTPADDLARAIGEDNTFWLACLSARLVVCDGERAVAALSKARYESPEDRRRERARERQRARRARLAGTAPVPLPSQPAEAPTLATDEPPATVAFMEPVPGGQADSMAPDRGPTDLFGNPLGTPNPSRALDHPHPLFPEFYAAYPKHVGKKDALKAFNRIDPNRGELDVMLAALTRYTDSDGVKRGYVLNPATWLNGRRWEDKSQLAGVGRASRVEAEPSQYDKVARVVEM